MDLTAKVEGLKILLIDDDELIRVSLRLFFENRGCFLMGLETAEEGIEWLRQNEYDIILIDYKLVGMDGLEFLKRIQKTHPKIIKILITAHGNEELFSEAKKIGAQDIIEKPLTPEAIEESLSRVIKERM